MFTWNLTKDNTSSYTLLSSDNGGCGYKVSQISAIDNTVGPVAWLTESGVPIFTFDEMRISGNSSLAINPTDLAPYATVSQFCPPSTFCRKLL